MKPFPGFLVDGAREAFRGGRLYWSWLGVLSVLIVAGVAMWITQLRTGMLATGLSDQVSWGTYIANFAFLEGIGAAAILILLPAYVFHREDLQRVVLMSQGVAVATVLGAMLFVVVDLGRPDRLWHMIPLLGRFNFPASLMAWDVLMLSVYFLVSLITPFYILYRRYRGETPNPRVYVPVMVFTVVWGVLILTVTAFLFSSNVGRPFWASAILGPRFVAAAFTSGTAFILLALQVIHRFTSLKVSSEVFRLLALIVTVALQVNLFLFVTEFFTEFYHPTEHGISAFYLYFGYQGHDALVPWIWSALAFNIVAVVILTINPLRERLAWLNVACVLAIVGIWIEKTMGLIVPGFIPTPLGEIFEYAPSVVEVLVSLGIWALVLLVFTLLARVACAVQCDELTHTSSGVS